jgi:Trk K+ transport system NAD-binding subunit
MKAEIIICGFGQIGFRTFQVLARLEKSISVISKTTNPDWKAEAEKYGAHFLEGDASDDQLLLAAGIQTATSILALTDNDLSNLSISIDAKRLNPNIAVITRMFDQDIASQIEKTLGIRRALSTSALAAPLFTASAYDKSSLGYFSYEGKSFRLLASKHFSGGGGKVKLAALTRDTKIVASKQTSSEDDEVLYLEEVKREPSRPKHFRKLRGFGALVMQTPQTLKAVLGVIALFSALGMILFHQFLHLSLIDAFYFTVTTITTVGYGDFNLSNAGWPLKLYGCFLMFLGAMGIATLFSFVSDLLLSEKFKQLFGRDLHLMSNHYILTGDSSIALRVARELKKAGEEVVVIDALPQGTFAAALRGVASLLEGDPSQIEVLEKACVGSAKSILALSEDDLKNLSTVVNGRKVNPNIRTVVRIFDSTLASKFKDVLGLNAVLSVSRASAPTLASSAINEGVLYAFAWKNCLVSILDSSKNGDAAVQQINESNLGIKFQTLKSNDIEVI